MKPKFVYVGSSQVGLVNKIGLDIDIINDKKNNTKKPLKKLISSKSEFFKNDKIAR